MSKKMIAIITVFATMMLGFVIVFAMLWGIKRDLSAILEENAAIVGTVAIAEMRNEPSEIVAAEQQLLGVK